MGHRPKCKTTNYKTPRQEFGENLTGVVTMQCKDMWFV